MVGIEARILGPDPRAKASAKLGEQKIKIVSENPDNDFIKVFPHVFFQEEGVRYNPDDGTLWVASYHPTAEAKDVLYKRWSKHSSLESATGASAEILSKYDKEGNMAQKTQVLDTFIRGKLKQFGEGAITDAQLDEFRDESEGVLKELGFSNPRKPSKTKVAEQVKKAMGKDSLGRRNPLISRTRLASALLTVLTEYEFQDRVAAKHLRLFIAFLGEQQLEESIVQSVIESFENGNYQPDILKDAVRISVVKAKPFRKPIMQAYALTFGIPKGRQTEFLRYFEDDDDLLEMANDSHNRADEIHVVVEHNLRQALEDGASIYSPSV